MRIVLSCLAALALSACAGEPAEDLTCGGQAAFAGPGPRGAGVRTLTLADGTKVELFYPTAAPGESRYDLREWLPASAREKLAPTVDSTFAFAAARDAPIADGRFPLLVFSHGLGAYRLQSSALLAHLASHGLVVASPDHPERGLARVLENEPPDFTRAPETLLRTAAHVRGALASSLVEGRLGVFGHSAGGAASFEASADPAVTSYAALGSGVPDGGVDKPVLVMVGEDDGIVSAAEARRDFDALAAADKTFVSLRAAGHLAFSDLCRLGEAEGGILAIAKASGIEVSIFLEVLATDGCLPGQLTWAQAWPPIHHYVARHFLRTLAGAPDPSTDPAACFGPRLAAVVE